MTSKKQLPGIIDLIPGSKYKRKECRTHCSATFTMENCAELIPQIISAKEVWKGQTNRSDFINACNGVMKDILKARDVGKRECLFDPRPVEQRAAVKKEFLTKGYSFRPYGFCSGVWQNEEIICW